MGIVGSPTFDITWSGVEISPFDYDGLPINKDMGENFGLTLNGSMSSQICSVQWSALKLKHIGECTVPETERAGLWGLTATLDDAAVFSSSVRMRCKADKFEDPKTSKCVTCPRGTTCSAGMTLEALPLNSGYWRCGAFSYCHRVVQQAFDNARTASSPDSTSQTVLKCRYGANSCPGSKSSSSRRQLASGNSTGGCDETAGDKDPYCACGFRGPLCSECADGFFSSWAGRGGCKACGQSTNYMPVIVLGVVVAVCIGLVVAMCQLKNCKAWFLSQGTQASASDGDVQQEVALPTQDGGEARSIAREGVQQDDVMPNQDGTASDNRQVAPAQDGRVKSKQKRSSNGRLLGSAPSSVAETLLTKGQTKGMILFLMFQILSQFTAILGGTGESSGDGAFPEPAATFASGLGVANFDLLSYLPVGCEGLDLSSFYAQLKIKTLGPFVVVALLWIPALWLRLIGRFHLRAQAIASDFSLTVLELLLPSVSTTVFQTLICGASCRIASPITATLVP